MNRKEFGKLLAVLRKQHRDAHDNIFTQARLAEETGLSEIVIGKIERGTKQNLDPDILLKLASALRLTIQERKEFLLAASCVDERQLYQEEYLIQQALSSLVSILEQLRTPAYISNCFGDLICVNPLALAVYHLPLHVLQHSPSHQPARFNFMRLLFAPEFEDQRKRMGTTWAAFAHQTVLLLRVSSFRFQAHPYFRQELLPELNTFPLFRQFWQTPRTEEDLLFTNFNWLSIAHPEWGPLQFVSSPLLATTPLGDLILNTFHPLGLETLTTCLKIAETTGVGAIYLSSWPVTSFYDGLDEQEVVEDARC
jgi:transcriptional regulator with XRE-family HTH domain